MNVKKTIKRITAITAGLAMIGATVMGAAAADLSNYPSPFVNNGMFNGLIIVGDNAAASDVIGAVDIGTSLQYSSRKEVLSDKISITEGVLIEAAGNDLNYGESIADIDSKLTDEDLPAILSDGRYKESKRTKNDVTYTQKISFTKGSTELVFEADDNDPDEPVDNYLKLIKNQEIYSYELEFDSDVEFDPEYVNDEFKGSKIDIMGTTYTITSADESTDAVDKLVLHGGSISSVLEEGGAEIYTLDGKEYLVKVIYIGKDSVRLNVNGVSTETLEEDESEAIEGIDLTIEAIMAQNLVGLPDQIEFTIGSQEIILENGNEIKLNGETIDGTVVDIDSEEGTLSGISIEYSIDDDEYIKAGDEWTDPVFGLFKIMFGGIVRDIEDIKITTKSDAGSLEFVNNEGDKVEIHFIDDDEYLGLGDDDDYLKGTIDSEENPIGMLIEDAICNGSEIDNDAEDCEGILMLGVSAGNEARVYKITKVDIDEGKYDIKDLTKGIITTDLEFGAEEVIGPMNFQLDLSSDNDTITAVSLGDIEDIRTEKGARLSIYTTDEGVDIELSADPDGEDIYLGGVSIGIDSDGDQKITVSDVDLMESKDNSDIEIGIDSEGYGAVFVYDSDNKDSLDIRYPEEEIYGQVYISPVAAEVRSMTEGYETIPIPVGTSKLASEVRDITKVNSIIIGGPCANEAASAVMGNPDNCANGFVEGKALIKLYEHGEFVSLLVAGMTADDTRRAARVLATYEDHELVGMEVEVRGTSLSDYSIATLE